jgi:hypothetical protein
VSLGGTERGTLTGIGSITGEVRNEGTIDLGQGGAPVGLLSINGDYTQTETGALRLRLQAAANSQYDRVAISGTATLGGALTVAALGGFAPVQGDMFAILTYTNHNGDFNQPYGLPALNAPRSWAPASPGPTSLTLTVQ